jgi:hypothetical protein
MVELAQLVRAPDCGPGGRGFNSHIPPQAKNNNRSNEQLYSAPVAQLDRVSDFGSDGYRFESYRAHHLVVDSMRP